jgi:hypothetical protein
MVVRDLADLLSPDPQKAELDGASDDS